jgi:hypothetical protein
MLAVIFSVPFFSLFSVPDCRAVRRVVLTVCDFLGIELSVPIVVAIIEQFADWELLGHCQPVQLVHSNT